MESPSLIHVCALASGGMGRVEIAVRREPHFERLFAVKRLHAQYASDPHVRDMFMDEARIAGLIRHPNVVHVVDVGRDADGPFLVMEYVEGLPVSQLLEHHASTGKLMPVSVALELVRQTALGLHAAHGLVDATGTRVGLIHRDVSPQNILVSYDGCARLTDFGIAKASERLAKTQTGVLKGKMGYLSPEQLHFEDPTQRSDLFSLGVVLYETLAGQRLYGEKGVAAARRILKEPPPDLEDVRPDVPDEVIDLVFRSLAKDPAHRPASAKHVADVLKGALSALPEDDREDLSDYMTAHFSEVVQERRSKVAKILEAMDRETQPRAVSSSPSPRRKKRLAFAAVFLAIAGGLLALVMTTSEGDSLQVDPPPVTPIEAVLPATPTMTYIPDPEPIGAEAEAPLGAEVTEPVVPSTTMTTMRPRRGTRQPSAMRGQAWETEY